MSAASFLIVACLATAIILRIKDRKCWGCRCAFGLVMRAIIILIAAVIAALWVMEEYVAMSISPLAWCIFGIGTICTLNALYDTIHDVLIKKINNTAQGQSDAVMFANEICGTARCWGLICLSHCSGVRRFISIRFHCLILGMLMMVMYTKLPCKPRHGITPRFEVGVANSCDVGIEGFDVLYDVIAALVVHKHS